MAVTPGTGPGTGGAGHRRHPRHRGRHLPRPGHRPGKGAGPAPDQIPVGRLGAADEIARVVCFLAADASRRADDTEDPRWDQVRDLYDMPAHLRSEIHHFFDVYKALEPGKSTSTTGFEGREAALGEIAASRARLLHHQQQASAAASVEVPREAVPAAYSVRSVVKARMARV